MVWLMKTNPICLNILSLFEGLSFWCEDFSVIGSQKMAHVMPSFVTNGENVTEGRILVIIGMFSNLSVYIHQTLQPTG